MEHVWPNFTYIAGADIPPTSYICMMLNKEHELQTASKHEYYFVNVW